MYILEKHYRYTDEVKKFSIPTKEELKDFFFSYFGENNVDRFNYPKEECFNLGHASFTDFYIVVIKDGDVYKKYKNKC